MRLVCGATGLPATAWGLTAGQVAAVRRGEVKGLVPLRELNTSYYCFSMESRCQEPSGRPGSIP
eukprot:362819-Chlamydomonas_euryale.AAC.5